MAIYSSPNLPQPVKTGIFKCHSLRPKMPALSNPRHEAFAQALFAGLAGETRVKRAQSTAYLTAYPNCSSGNSAEACASKLLRRAKPILGRVRELQAEANARQQTKIDLSRERVGRDLDTASRLAKEQGNVAGMVASAMGIAKGHLEKFFSPSRCESDSLIAMGHGRMERASHGADGLFRC